eukprot:s100_g34.t1
MDVFTPLTTMIEWVWCATQVGITRAEAFLFGFTALMVMALGWHVLCWQKKILLMLQSVQSQLNTADGTKHEKIHQIHETLQSVQTQLNAADEAKQSQAEQIREILDLISQAETVTEIKNIAASVGTLKQQLLEAVSQLGSETGAIKEIPTEVGIVKKHLLEVLTHLATMKSVGAVYLVLREMIWPLQSPPTLLPKWLRARLDHRLTFSFIPPAGMDDGHPDREAFIGMEHGSLSGLAGNVAVDWSLAPAHTLPNEEREMLKTILTETVEVLLRRHEIVHKEAPQVIYLKLAAHGCRDQPRPTFLLQMERVLVASMCYAVKSRIINEELSTHRDTWGKWLFGILDDTKSYVKEVLFGFHSICLRHKQDRTRRNILRSHSDRPWHDEGCEHLSNAQHLVKRPVSTEDIQIALYSLWPELENNHLREIVHAHKGIIDMHGSVSHIFDSDMHAASIVRRRTRSVRVEGGINMDAININGVGATKQPHDFDEEQEDPSRAMLEDEMPLPTDIRIETGMVKILKASRRSVLRQACNVFSDFVEQAPPVATLSIVIRAWKTLLWAAHVTVRRDELKQQHMGAEKLRAMAALLAAPTPAGQIPQYVCYLCTRKFADATALSTHETWIGAVVFIATSMSKQRMVQLEPEKYSQLHQQNLDRQDELIKQHKEEVMNGVHRLRQQLLEAMNSTNPVASSRAGALESQLRQQLGEFGQAQEALEHRRAVRGADPARLARGAQADVKQPKLRPLYRELKVGHLMLELGAACWQGGKETNEDRFALDLEPWFQ